MLLASNVYRIREFIVIHMMCLKRERKVLERASQATNACSKSKVK